MADGDEAAIVNGLRDDAQNSIPGAAKAPAEFGDDTSAGMSKGLEGHAATEASNTRILENAGKRPAETPLENPSRLRHLSVSSRVGLRGLRVADHGAVHVVGKAAFEAAQCFLVALSVCSFALVVGTSWGVALDLGDGHDV